MPDREAQGYLVVSGSLMLLSTLTLQYIYYSCSLESVTPGI